MIKPVILCVDDDPNVLSSVNRDLQNRYAKDFRIVAINSGEQAIDFMKKSLQTEGQIALFLADQRMPQMTGVEFLYKARMVFPAAKRVLLTAYADTEASIQAINTVGLDYYLLKPWSPPEEKLFPFLDDLLSDWMATVYPVGQRNFNK